MQSTGYSLSPRASRPFTTPSHALGGTRELAASLAESQPGFGLPRQRYQQISARSTSPSRYFKARGDLIARSARERSGASGNSPIAGYSQCGAPMRGVTSYPFEKQQNAYVEQFAPIVANQLVHPYQAITENNADSIPHNIITGSAYSASALQMSEYKRAYPQMAMKRKPFGRTTTISQADCFPGLRSEEMITVGQYTPVLRSGSPRAGYSAG